MHSLYIDISSWNIDDLYIGNCILNIFFHRYFKTKLLTTHVVAVLVLLLQDVAVEVGVADVAASAVK